MSRNTILIDKFAKGMVESVDEADLPSDASPYMTNCEVTSQPGVVRAVKAPVVTSIATPIFANQYEWIKRTDGKYDLVYWDKNDGLLKMVLDFYGTKAYTNVKKWNGTNAYVDFDVIAEPTFAPVPKGVIVSWVNTTNTEATGIPDNKSLWIGYCDANQFNRGLRNGFSGTLHLFSWDGELHPHVYPHASEGSITNSVYIATATQSVGTIFTAGDIYRYRTSLIYDGFQESPLGAININDTIVTIQAGGSGNIAIAVVVKIGTTTSYEYEVINPRISGINIYREKWNTATNEYDAPVLAKYIPIEGFPALLITWNLTGANPVITVSDTGSSSDGLYEERTNIPVTLTRMDIHWKLVQRAYGYHFYGDCGVLGLTGDIKTMLFRSKSGRPNTVDWTNDYLNLSFAPEVLVGYRNNIFAFNKVECVEVDPESFRVRAEYKEFGILSNKAWIVIRDVLYVADTNHVYAISDNGINPITEAVKESAEPTNRITYRTMDKTTLKLGYDEKNHNLLIMSMNASTGNTDMLLYNIEQEVWNGVVSLADANQDWGNPTLIMTPLGDCYTTDDTSLFQPFRHASTTYAATYVSPQINFGVPGQYKKVYKAYAKGTSISAVKYRTDAQTSWQTLTANAVSSSYWKCKWVQFLVEFTGRLESLEVVYRKMEDER